VANLLSRSRECGAAPLLYVGTRNRRARRAFSFAVKLVTRQFAARLLASVCVAACLTGCTSVLTEGTSAGAGVASAAIAHGVTRNAGVTTGIGLGVQAAARAGLQYAERKVHQSEQDSIAAAAGALPVGAVGRWQAVHDIPIEPDEQGEVVVNRALGGGDIACKEIVFSVDHVEKSGTAREFYTATVCRDGAQWKWATAEPATERWGALQ
jgi:hypothetical protein